jgi:hypothetical protein
MENIPSTLDTGVYRKLVLQLLNSMSSGGGGGGNDGFVIPAYNDVVLQYSNTEFPTKPTYITFKQNGTNVYYVALEYDANGALTRVFQD